MPARGRRKVESNEEINSEIDQSLENFNKRLKEYNSKTFISDIQEALNNIMAASLNNVKTNKSLDTFFTNLSENTRKAANIAKEKGNEQAYQYFTNQADSYSLSAENAKSKTSTKLSNNTIASNQSMKGKKA